MNSKILPTWKKQLPNAITLLRIAFVPLVVLCLIQNTPEYDFWGAIFFITASVSDWIDGYLARLYKVESVLGQLMDPVADKLLVMGALIMMIPIGRVSALLALVFLSRDIFIAGLRAAAASQNVVIPAGSFGKWKTGIQMFALPALILNRNWIGIDLLILGRWLLIASVILSLISAAQYILIFSKRTRF
jgi:CDP-diacylglycerol--glycerol-3-phosphate 3-phosphatidyltransferase